VVLAVCRPGVPPPDVDAAARRYVQLARALARHDPSLIDHWLAEPPADSRARDPVAGLRHEADRLARDLERLRFAGPAVAPARVAWLEGQVQALRLAARRLLGESLSFDTEAQLAFGIPPPHADWSRADRARASLERALPGAGPIEQRLAAFQARFHVPGASRDAVFRAALAACRAATDHQWPLPAGEAVEVAFVEGLPWDAHARYLGRQRTRIEVNARAPLDLTRALRLACHEGYAGHHVQHLWTAGELIAQRGWIERALVPGFGPALLVAEGTADAATELAMPADRRVVVYRDVLAPAAGLRVRTEELSRLVEVEDALTALEPLIGEIARDYLDHRLTAAGAAERLAADVLMRHAEPFVTFIEQRRTRILAYTEGRRLVRERAGARGLAGIRTVLVPPS
jgi:hypothetical protein